MIDLHYIPSGNNLKIGIALQELELEHRLVRHDMFGGTHQTPEFRRINPNAKLPAIVDHAPANGGEPLAVFESGAILLYFAGKSGRLMPTNWRLRQVALQWLVWQVAGLGPMLGQANHFCRYAPEDQAYGVDRYLREARRLLTVLDRQVRDRDFIAEEYSMADIACFPWVAGTASVGIATEEFPALNRWLARIEQRPAIAAARAEIFDGDRAKYTQARARLTPDEWSRLFGEQLLASARAE